MTEQAVSPVQGNSAQQQAAASSPPISVQRINTVNPLDKIRKVTLRSTKEERTFDVLTITSPEDMVEAKDIHTMYKMQAGNNRFMQFSLTGISLADWSNVEAEVPIPTAENDEEENTPDFKMNKEAALTKKRMKLFELAMRQPIPGDTDEEKISFMEKRCHGELEALYAYITQGLANFSDGLIMADYNAFLLETADRHEEVVSVNSFDDWKEAGDDLSYVLRMQRPFDKYLIEIPLRSIKSEAKRLIDNSCVEEAPPMRPKKNKNGSWDASNMVPNYYDPMWLRATRETSNRRMLMVLEACLPFSIPGNTSTEKFDWLGKRLVGDVVRIRNYAAQQLLGYGDRFSFFTIASDHGS